MTHELKKDDIRAVQMFMLQHPSARLIRNYLQWSTFNTGDVLIRYRTDEEGREKIETVSSSCDVPKKYKIVYIAYTIGGSVKTQDVVTDKALESAQKLEDTISNQFDYILTAVSTKSVNAGVTGGKNSNNRYLWHGFSYGR